tara:strand:+ start:115 stop:1506 length:1392 start_codon:yes stop_codon:yes gene_type:complete
VWRDESLVVGKELDDRIRRFQSQSISFIHSDDDAIKRKISASMKVRVKQAAGEKCPLCPNTMISSSIKKTPLDDRESTPDHILDLGLGGNNTEENFLILCLKCNWAKNHAMQRHLTISGMHKGAPGHKPWRVAFRRKGSNIAKLLEYVEWSFRIEEPSSEHRFPELHGYFMQSRFGKSEEPKSIIEKTSDKISETPTISELVKGLEKLENTLWKKLIRLIGGLFVRKRKTASKPEKPRTNLLTEPSEFPKLDFTPEDFAKGLLRQRTREGQMTYNFLYDQLIKENPKFNLSHYGIKPSSYLQDECSYILSIEKRMHKNGITSTLWINDKPEVQRNVVPDLKIDSTKLIDNAKESAAKSSQKQIAKQQIRIARTNTHAKDPTVEDFRTIVLDIIGGTPDSKISISALGQRFSKRVQDLGFTNKGEFFTSVGISSSLTISKAIGEYFEDNEVIIDGIHVLGNRRG